MTMHLSGFFLEACQDIPTAESGVLYSRFLGWRSVPTQMIDVSCE